MKRILFLLALFFSLLMSEAVNIIFNGDCSFFSFLFHSQFILPPNDFNTSKKNRVPEQSHP